MREPSYPYAVSYTIMKQFSRISVPEDMLRYYTEPRYAPGQTVMRRHKGLPPLQVTVKGIKTTSTIYSDKHHYTVRNPDGSISSKVAEYDLYYKIVEQDRVVVQKQGETHIWSCQDRVGRCRN